MEEQVAGERPAEPDGSLLTDLLHTLAPKWHDRVAPVASDVVASLGGRLDDPHTRFRALEIVANRLFAIPEFDAFLALLDAAPAVAAAPQMPMCRLRALEAIGRTDELRAALRETIPQPGPHATLFCKMQVRNGVASQTSQLEALFGPVSKDIEDILSALPAERWRTPSSDALAAALHPLSDDRTQPLESYARRLAWGRAAESLVMALNFAARRDERLAALYEALRARQQTPALAPLVAAKEAGRSILIAYAHAGATIEARELLRPLDLKEVLVVRNGGRSVDKEGDVRVGTAHDRQVGFLKVLKLVKREQRLIRLFPDGPEGGDRLAFDLLGRTVTLGPGAASLAWHARAATFFVGTRWIEGGTALGSYVVEGPVADLAVGEREAFEDEFHAFYIDRLRDIAIGPPEDIVGIGGIWPRLRAPNPAK